MAEKSTYNSSLAIPSRVGMTSVKVHPNGVGTADPDRIENRVFFQEVATGNSDKYYAEVAIVQASGSQDHFQAQYCVHHRWLPSVAKTKGADWSAVSNWKAAAPVKRNGSVVFAKDSEADADEWLGCNVARNKASSIRVFYKIEGTFPADVDAYSYRFRVRTYNIATKKHGKWCYSQWLHVEKAPRVANPVFYFGTSGNLIFECNIRYGERGGIFQFKNLYNSKGQEILVGNKYNAKMIVATGRTAQSDPPLREGFVPARCVIPAKAIKRLPAKTDKIFMNSTSVFNGNNCIGDSSLTLNSTTDQTKTIKGSLYKHIRFGTEDIVLGNIKLVLKEQANRAFVVAYVYRTAASLDDDIGSVSATLWYTYMGKNYSVQPTYKKFNFSRHTLTNYIAYFIFTKCPIGPKLAVRAYATNEHGSSATVANAIYLTHPFWYFQKEGDSSKFAVLQWNVTCSKETTTSYAMNLPYGRSKPFVAYGTGLNNKIEIKGEIATKTKDPAINTEYAMRDNWRAVQSSPGIYLVRGSAGFMIRMAITSVTLSESADSEILTVSISGTEVE